jgi:hypothetical protein
MMRVLPAASAARTAAETSIWRVPEAGVPAVKMWSTPTLVVAVASKAVAKPSPLAWPIETRRRWLVTMVEVA